MNIPAEDRPPQGVVPIGFTSAGNVPAHSRYCHKCQFNGRTDETARRACIACPGAPEDRPSKGVSHVSIDAMPSEGSIIREFKKLDRPAQVSDDATITAGELRRIFYTLAELGRVDILVLHGLLKGMNLANAARYAGVFRQIGHNHARRAVEKLPLLAAIFPYCPKRSHKHKKQEGADNAKTGNETGARP